MDSWLQLEAQVNLFLQSLGGWLSVPMSALTFLGNEEFFLLAMPFLFWCVNASLGFRIGIMLMLSNAVNAFFKVLFRGPRPYWIEPRVTAYTAETSFGVPSGHSQNSASLWGLAAAKINRRWVWVVFSLIVFGVGLSRLYLGVHFLRDVLLGWTLGALLVIAFTRWEKAVCDWLRPQSLQRWILLSAAAALVLLLVMQLPIALLSPAGYPQEWAQAALLAAPEKPITPFERSGSFTIAGTFFGMTAGYAYLLKRKGGFDASGLWWKKALRYVLGGIVLLALWFGLGQIFPRGEDLISYILRFLRYTLIGVWVSALAPIIFLRFGLASPILRPEPTQKT